MAPAAVLRSLPGLAGSVPAPPASVDPYLDAAVRCFARHGIGRTSVQDIARELKVDRTTVYRQVGNIEAIVRLLAGRELHRLLEDLPARLSGLRGPDAIVDLLTMVIESAQAHPVLRKVLADEPELIGPFIVAELPMMIDLMAAAATPLLQAAMDAGELARRDPERLAQMLVRLCLPLVLAPPPGDVTTVLAELLLPVLTPEP
ncbi:MAG: TetR/AcrR family transcriptional regulator [Acidimicrobiales bacterium]